MIARIREKRNIIVIFCLLAILFTTCSASNALKNFLERNNRTLPVMPSYSDVILLDAELQAYCFANVNGVVYDLNPLYDATSDYMFKSKNITFYYNFCKFATTKCKKDNTYMIATNPGSVFNNTSNDCNLLTGTNYQSLPKWKIKSKHIYKF
jgi:hypothetical protein